MTPLESIEAQAEIPLDLDAAETAALAPVPEATSETHVFTGRLVARREPEKYRLFCSLYFDAGLGQMQICRLLKMSPQTGAAIIAAECASRPAAELREKQAARARAVVSMAMSAIQERLADPAALKEIPIRDLAAVIQRAGDQAQLLDGQATARVEKTVKKEAVSDDDVRDYLDRHTVDYVEAHPQEVTR